VLHDPDSHQLLSVVAAVHHQGVGQALDDGTLGFSEALDGVATGGVGDVDWGADLNVVAVVEKNVSTGINSLGLSTRIQPPAHSCICVYGGDGNPRQRDIPNLDILVTPLVEQLDRSDLIGDFLGENAVGAIGRFDLDFAVVRHGGCCKREGFKSTVVV
jgi:hypothetical protein